MLRRGSHEIRVALRVEGVKEHKDSKVLFWECGVTRSRYAVHFLNGATYGIVLDVVWAGRLGPIPTSPLTLYAE